MHLECACVAAGDDHAHLLAAGRFAGSLAGWGDLAVLHSGTAALLCLVPGVIALLLVGLFHNQPDQQLTVALASTSLRMFFVLGAAFLLERTVPLYHGSLAFWIWVLVFYLLTLAVETLLLVLKRSPGRNA